MHQNLQVHFVPLERAVTRAPLRVKLLAILLLACLQANATVTPQAMFLSKNSVTVSRIVKADQPEHSAAASLSFQVSGTVREVNGEPLPGATVRLRDGEAGTVTDARGRFTFEMPDGGGVLIVSYIGFLTEEVAVSEPSDALDIQLTPSVSEMEELVVIGYGTQKRADLTGSISSISSEEIAKVPVTTMAQVLQGRSAGVNIINNDGSPNGGTQIQIRGIGSLGNNDPLIVVDGYPISGGLNSINPNDIATIDILKDASATAIYGNRAANGVVIINTKRGTEGLVEVSFDAMTSIQSKPEMHDLLNAQQWGVLVNEIQAVEGFAMLPEWTNPSALHSIDWQEEIYRQGLRQNYNLAIRGGGAKSQGAFSAGYTDHKGIVIGSSLKRINLSLNLDYDPLPWLKSSSSFKYTRGNSKSTIGTGSIEGINKLPPAMIGNIYTDRVKDEEGNYGFYNPVHPIGGGYNPVYVNDSNDQKNLTNTFLGTTSLEATIAAGLKVKTNFGINTIEYSGYNFNPSDSRAVDQYGSSVQSSLANYSQGANNTFEWLWENTVSYARTFGDHSVDVVAGISAQENTYRQVGVSGQGLASDGLRNAASLQTNIRVYGNEQTFSLASQFGRIQYKLKDKYLVTGTVRRDGSSRFAPEHQYGIFPSGSVAWRISGEPFMASLNFISDMKIRASYGEVGNQSSIGLFQYLSLWTPGPPQSDFYNIGYPFNKVYQPGLALSALPNPELKWETTKLTNLGLDVEFLSGGLKLSLDYYIKRSQDFLLNIPVPAQTGFTTAARNVGSIENRGLEVVIDYRKTSRDFSYGVNLNVSTIRNELLSLADGQTALSNFQLNSQGLFEAAGTNSWGEFSQTEIGGEVGEFYGYVSDGIFQTQEEIDALNVIAKENHGPEANYHAGNITRPGDRKFVDTNGDGWVNQEDRVRLGSPIPDLFGSLNFDVAYKAFDLSLFFYGTYGNKILNYNQASLESFDGLGNVTVEYRDNAWTPERPSNRYTRITVFDYNQNRNYRPSDVYVEDGSYLRLRNVQIGYTFPQALVNKIAMSRARVYFSAQNLFTITGYSGLDPEIGLPMERNGARNVHASGVDIGTYPSSKYFTFGLSATF